MFEKILLEHTSKLLNLLKAKDLPNTSYLAGGTAIALQLGHRRSVDLDFFVRDYFSEDVWLQKLEQDFRFKLRQKDKQTLLGTIGKAKFSLLGYNYPLLEDLLMFNQIPVASLPDLAAMKLSTILSRGTKRDLIDIYFLAKKYGLKELFKFYDKKFGNLSDREVMIKKALIYFEEADEDEMPDILVPTDWKKIKSWFVKQVKNLQ